MTSSLSSKADAIGYLSGQDGALLFSYSSSVSGQDEINRALWLAAQVGKFKLHVSCLLGTTRSVQWEKIPIRQNNQSFIDQAFSVKMARYWPSSFFANLLYGPRLHLSPQTRKKNLANIQPSWLHTCLLRTTSCVQQEKCPNINNPLLTKLGWSRWLNVGVIFYLHVYGPWLYLIPSHLVNI